MTDDRNSITDYKIDWQETDKGLLTNLIDDVAFAADKALGEFVTIDSEREQMLKDSPELDIRNLEDGYELEVEKLNAINQKRSKGFHVVDVNPGLLDPIENALNLPYEFIFDGTNFLPAVDGSLTKNFRSVNIPIAGTFCKIEFIYENNSTANQNIIVSAPFANIKYSQNLNPNANGPENDLTTNQTTYSFDSFARNKVWVDFGPSTGKPHLVPTSGRIFKTYFSELNISLNMGAPKIRITIGTNSEIQETNSNSAAINAKLALTGSGRLLNDSDTVMSPFCITDNDQGVPIVRGNGTALVVPSGGQTLYSPLLVNNGFNLIGTNLVSLGYSIVWITRIYFNYYDVVTTAGANDVLNLHFYLFLTNVSGVGFTPPTEKRVHNFFMTMRGGSVTPYVFEPSEPIRVVIPSGWQLWTSIYTGSTTSTQIQYSFSIDGYSYGEILRNIIGEEPPYSTILQTSKYITDSTFLSDYNRINNLKDGL